MGRRRHPQIFQGRLRAKSYFEGWYFKLVDPTGHHVYAIIPGIALDKKNSTSHAFIQILNGKTAAYNYLQFPLSDFEASRSQFFVKIGMNSFSETQLSVSIDEPNIHIHGDLMFTNINSLPSSLLRPNIMGPFTYLPFMECYHGLVNLNSKIEGFLTINDQRIDFTGGKGYIEKDYGTSFPDNWIWMQSNHFSENSTTFFFSLARIPYIGLKFSGFLCVLTHLDKKMVFATYTGAKITNLRITPESVNVQIEDSRTCLKISAKTSGRENNGRAIMQAPKKGQMTTKCIETIDAHIEIQLFSKKAKKSKRRKKSKISNEAHEVVEILHDTGKIAGLEIMATQETFRNLSLIPKH